MSAKRLRTADEMKKAAAMAVLPKIQNGMVVGLGTGSTADHFTRALAEKVLQGLRVKCVPTSEATATLARSLGLELVTLDEHPFIDITVDGTDEIDPEFRLIKGGGGAMLVEKIVASSSKFMVVIADESKQVKTLGKFKLPIEVIPFGVKATAWKLERAFKTFDMEPKFTMRTQNGEIFRTDSGNCIIDCACGEIKQADRLEFMLNNLPGVVNNGLFIGICGVAYIARSNGIVEELYRP